MQRATIQNFQTLKRIQLLYKKLQNISIRHTRKILKKSKNQNITDSIKEISDFQA
jgi:hypothetical protein